MIQASILRHSGVGIACCLLLIACQPKIETHGYAPRSEQLEGLVVGTDTRETVAQKIGRPSTSGIFDENAWYYISRVTQDRPLRSAKVLEQTVIAVNFNEEGQVSAVNQYGVEDGLIVDLVTRTTPTRGRQLGILQQLLGNIGRFNTPSSASSTVRRPGSL